jgi:hypothetical protein
MSGRELDPDGTDSYHPQHPWEQVGHELYIDPTNRTAQNWPPVSDATPAGTHEAGVWSRLPGSEAAKWREHSTILNRIGWRISQALGRVSEDAESVIGDPERDLEELINRLNGNSAPGDDGPADPAIMLQRNGANLETGMIRARRMLNAMRRNDRKEIEESWNGLVRDHIRMLDTDALEQLAMNGLTTAVHLQDQVTTLQARLGRKR